MKTLGPFRLQRDAVRNFYDIHAWTGILSGLALFVCAFSGTIALFERELTFWERPSIRFDRPQSAPAAPQDVDQLLQRARDYLGTESNLFVTLPVAEDSGLQARASGEHGVTVIDINPYTGEVVEHEGESAFAFLTHLHTDLHLPRPFGRYLVGLLGIVMLLSLISGVMSHPKIVKDIFLLRWRPKLRLSASDLHKQLGVWGLAFGLVMALTGALLGLLGLIAPIMVLSAFGGDVGKATEAFSGPSIQATEIAAPMLPVGPMIAALEEHEPGLEATSLFFRKWGDQAAEVSINLDRAPYKQLTAGETHRLSLVNGETLHVSSLTDRGIGARLFGSIQPLHYGLFGGLGLRLLYLVSGLLLSLGIVTGTVIWLERRKRTADDRARRRYQVLSKLHLGVSLGLVVASALAIAAGRFMPSAVETTFWATWLAGLVAAFFVADGIALTRGGVLATGLILAGVGAADLVASPHLSPTVRQVDLVLMILGLSTAATAMLGRGKVRSRGTVTSSQRVPMTAPRS